MSNSNMLDRITPVILTYNEQPNLARTLVPLSWARRIVVLDSFSDDGTVEQLREDPRISVYQRHFDCFANQWNHALRETAIDTPWVLALDADYGLTESLTGEIAAQHPEAEGISGYTLSFVYCVFGKPLRGTLYPPSTCLFERAKAHCIQDGHAHRFVVAGKLRPLAGKIRHDDRKPLRRWIQSPEAYMRIEREVIANTPWKALSWPDRARNLRFVSPFLVIFHVLILQGVLLDGRAGLYYALQRLIAEAFLMLYLLEKDLGSD